MITIKVTENNENKSARLEVSGHAGYAEYDKDIVCSAVSILTYTVAQLVLEMGACGRLSDPPIVKLTDGDSVIEAKCKTGIQYTCEAMRIMHFAKAGYALLQNSYPEYVKFVINEA